MLTTSVIRPATWTWLCSCGKKLKRNSHVRLLNQAHQGITVRFKRGIFQDILDCKPIINTVLIRQDIPFSLLRYGYRLHKQYGYRFWIFFFDSPKTFIAAPTRSSTPATSIPPLISTATLISPLA